MEIESCSKCSVLATCRTQIVFPTKAPKHGILAIGEAPGADEDEKGEGFVGAAGKTLDRIFGQFGIARHEYGRANVCRCRPPENRKPTKQEIAACLPKLAEFIIETKPSVILTVGGTPSSIFCGKGTLSSMIQGRDRWEVEEFAEHMHPVVRDAVIGIVRYIVPMPHTSPLAFNRNAPWGEKWAEIGVRQIRTACELLGRQE